MSLLNRLPCVPFVPAWSTCPHVNVPKAWQLLIFTCQRTNNRANVPTGQRQANVSNWRANVPSCVNFSTWCANLPKSVLFFQLPLPNAKHFRKQNQVYHALANII